MVWRFGPGKCNRIYVLEQAIFQQAIWCQRHAHIAINCVLIDGLEDLARRDELGWIFFEIGHIARALVHEPRLVVCDEPTAALDARSGRRVMDLLREVAVAEDRACIIVTHDNRIFDLADRILVLEDGRVTHDGTEMPEGH